MKRASFGKELLIGILFTLFVLSTAATLIIQFRPFYYVLIPVFDLPALSGFPKEEILLNFNVLMDYLTPFSGGELVFPTFAASAEGIIHFEEVKVLFELFTLLIPVSGIPLFFLLRQQKKLGLYHYKKVSSITMIALPVLVLSACAIDFDTAFVIFHKIFFRNNYWLFNPETDPVIKILPAEMFLLYGVAIALTVLLCSILLYFSYQRSKRQDVAM